MVLSLYQCITNQLTRTDAVLSCVLSNACWSNWNFFRIFSKVCAISLMFLFHKNLLTNNHSIRKLKKAARISPVVIEFSLKQHIFFPFTKYQKCLRKKITTILTKLVSQSIFNSIRKSDHHNNIPSWRFQVSSSITFHLGKT